MISSMIEILLYIFIFILVDVLFTKMNIEGSYYLIHAMCNTYIIYHTIGDVYATYYDFKNFYLYPMNLRAAMITFALHIYHIIWYFKRLRFDDWIHHILSVGIALPLSLATHAGTLLGHSLFYLTGLPGAIDYFLLFLNRNGIVNKLVEKKINSILNLWLRCPGCIAHSTLTLVGFNMLDESQLAPYSKNVSIITAMIVFWNGIYFMNQVVVNYAIISNNKK